MLGKLDGELVEVLGQLDLATQRPERLRDGTATLHGHQLGDWTAGALDDDLLAALGERYQLRELALGLMHADADHDRTVADA